MPNLEANQWVALNNLIYHIYAEEDPLRMRERFLQDLRLLIEYDSADFFLSGRLKKQVEEIRRGVSAGEGAGSAPTSSRQKAAAAGQMGATAGAASPSDVTVPWQKAAAAGQMGATAGADSLSDVTVPWQKAVAAGQMGATADEGAGAGHDPDFLTDPVYYNCEKNLSAEYDKMDYSRSLVYSGKAMVYRDTDVMPDEDRVKTEYFRRIYKANSWHYSLQLVLAYGGTCLGAATFYRREGEKNFSFDDVFLLDSLKEHLSLRLQRDYEREKEEAAREAERKPSVAEAASRFGLTERETTVLGLLMDGQSHPEICAGLSIANNTLKKHIQSIYRKVGVSGRLALFRTLSAR